MGVKYDMDHPRFQELPRFDFSGVQITRAALNQLTLEGKLIYSVQCDMTHKYTSMSTEKYKELDKYNLKENIH